MARKLAAICHTSFVSRTRWRSALPKESCRIENSPRAPGRAGNMDCCSPSNATPGRANLIEELVEPIETMGWEI
jgi:hypothetical protein